MHTKITIVLFALAGFFTTSYGADAGPTEPVLVPTFSSMSIYWNPPKHTGSCTIRYRVKGTSYWKEAQPMVYETVFRNEYRGSVVNLAPATLYEFELSADTQKKSLEKRTWQDALPISRTITLSSSTSSLLIDQGGTPQGYVLYEGSGATIDVGAKSDYAVKITAPYVILKGLTIKGGVKHGLRVEHELASYGDNPAVIVEECDISDWAHTYGYMYAGIFVENKAIQTVLQGNRVHDPRNGSNFWGANKAHPNGSNGIQIRRWEGSEVHANFVVRYNEIYSSPTKPFNDGIGEGGNSSNWGCPGTDSDIHGNIIRHAADDAMEMEGAGRNVRVFGNYTDHIVMAHVASAPVTIGPLYVFRNVFNRGLQEEMAGTPRYYAKLGYGSKGHQYWYHNSFLQDGSTKATTPMDAFLGVNGSIELLTTRNNILQSHSGSIVNTGSGNDIDYDLCNKGCSGSHTIKATAQWRSGHGPEADGIPKGNYQLAQGSSGHDKGQVLPNFSDGFEGAAPDCGAHEYGAAPLSFGIAAWNSYKSAHPLQRGSTSGATNLQGRFAHQGSQPPRSLCLLSGSTPAAAGSILYSLRGQKITVGAIGTAPRLQGVYLIERH